MRWSFVVLLAACDPTITVGPVEPSFVPDPLCEYFDSDVYYVACDGEDSPRSLTYFVPTGGVTEACPGYFGADTLASLDAAELIADMACDDTCVYAHDTAVMVLYCGARGEYISFDPRGPGQSGDGSTCPALLHVGTLAGDAWVESFEDYEATHACPE